MESVTHSWGAVVLITILLTVCLSQPALSADRAAGNMILINDNAHEGFGSLLNKI